MPDRFLRGHDLAQALADLRGVEGRLAGLAASPGEVRFHRLGPWLLERSFLRSLLERRLGRGGARAPAIPGLSRFGVVALAKAMLSPTLIRSESRAQAVHFKQSARAFYLLPRPISIKLSRSPASQQGFANEVEARQLAAGMLGCPRLIQHDLASLPRFLCEEMILGRRPDRARDRELVLDFVRGPLWSYYEACGFEFVRCGDLYDVDALVPLVRDAAREMEWDRAWLDENRFFEALARLGDERDRFVPCCRGHGDVSDGNLLVSDEGGAIYLIDWERARRLPVASELRKIFLHYEGAWDLLAPRLMNLTGGRPPAQIVPVARQALLDVVDWIAWFQRWSPPSETPDARQQRRLARKRGRRLRREFAAARRLIARGGL